MQHVYLNNNLKMYTADKSRFDLSGPYTVAEHRVGTGLLLHPALGGLLVHNRPFPSPSSFLSIRYATLRVDSEKSLGEEKASGLGAHLCTGQATPLLLFAAASGSGGCH